MCLAVPIRVKKVLPDDQALVELNGVETNISIALVDEVKAGDYVILHVGYALEKLDEQEAQASLDLFRTTGQAGSGTGDI